MKKTNIVKSLFLILFSLVLMVSVTYAWIAFSEDIDGGTVSVGEIDYSYNINFISNTEIIFPQKELLLDDVSVDNQSNIPTQLRMKIDYTLIEATTTTKTYKNDSNDDLLVTFIPSMSLDGDYWYYQTTSYQIDNLGVIALVSSILYDGNRASNEYSQQVINVSVLIQVKQFDNVDWIDLVNYDFTTGDPL